MRRFYDFNAKIINDKIKGFLSYSQKNNSFATRGFYLPINDNPSSIVAGELLKSITDKKNIHAIVFGDPNDKVSAILDFLGLKVIQIGLKDLNAPFEDAKKINSKSNHNEDTPKNAIRDLKIRLRYEIKAKLNYLDTYVQSLDVPRLIVNPMDGFTYRILFRNYDYLYINDMDNLYYPFINLYPNEIRKIGDLYNIPDAYYNEYPHTELERILSVLGISYYDIEKYFREEVDPTPKLTEALVSNNHLVTKFSPNVSNLYKFVKEIK